jgi:hypothetical protein
MSTKINTVTEVMKNLHAGNGEFIYGWMANQKETNQNRIDQIINQTEKENAIKEYNHMQSAIWDVFVDAHQQKRGYGTDLHTEKDGEYCTCTNKFLINGGDCSDDDDDSDDETLAVFSNENMKAVYRGLNKLTIQERKNEKAEFKNLFSETSLLATRYR